jgi:hypothetical protein
MTRRGQLLIVSFILGATCIALISVRTQRPDYDKLVAGHQIMKDEKMVSRGRNHRLRSYSWKEDYSTLSARVKVEMALLGGVQKGPLVTTGSAMLEAQSSVQQWYLPSGTVVMISRGRLREIGRVPPPDKGDRDWVIVNFLEIKPLNLLERAWAWAKHLFP